MNTVTEAQAQAMDDTASWALSNVVHLPRPAGNAAAVADATAQLESAYKALQLAQAMHAAARIDKDVGRTTPGLHYVSVYFSPIREFVTLGYSYDPEEPGDDEQPTISANLEISEVWLRGVDIGVLTMDHTDALETALTAATAGGKAL